MMKSLNGEPTVGEGIECDGGQGVNGIWFDRYTVSRSPSSSSVSASILER